MKKELPPELRIFRRRALWMLRKIDPSKYPEILAEVHQLCLEAAKSDRVVPALRLIKGGKKPKGRSHEGNF